MRRETWSCISNRSSTEVSIFEPQSEVGILWIVAEVLEGEHGERSAAGRVRSGAPRGRHRGGGKRRTRVRLEGESEVAGALEAIGRILLHAPAGNPVERGSGSP